MIYRPLVVLKGTGVKKASTAAKIEPVDTIVITRPNRQLDDSDPDDGEVSAEDRAAVGVLAADTRRSGHDGNTYG